MSLMSTAMTSEPTRRRRNVVSQDQRPVLGLDPGLARLGWAIVEVDKSAGRLVAAGCSTTAAGQPVAKRLDQQFRFIEKLISVHRPTRVALEQVFFTTNVSTAIVTGQVRGVALLAAARAGLPIVEFTPTAIKQAVTGDGRADKRQIQQMVKLLLHLSSVPRNDDTTDAIAIALCGAHTRHVP